MCIGSEACCHIQSLLHFCLVGSIFHSSLVGDDASLVKSYKMILEGAHSLTCACLHNRFHLRYLVCSYLALYGVCSDKYLKSGNTSLAVCSGDKGLGNYALEHICKLGSYLVVRVGRAGVDDTVDGLSRT